MAIASGNSPGAGAAKVLLAEIAVADKDVAGAEKLFQDALKVVTLGSNAPITLIDPSNDASSYALFACLGLAGGCPSDNPVLSTNSTRFGNDTNTLYGAGAIELYQDFGGFPLVPNGRLRYWANLIEANNPP